MSPVAPSCLCGECATCKNRDRARNYLRRRRANGGPLGLQPWAPKERPELTLDHAWLAGIIDGEGCISIRRPKYPTPSVALVVGMTHEPSVLRCCEIAGVGRVTLRTMKNRIKPLWAWSVYSKNAKDVLWLVLPLLVTKRDEAAAALGEVM